MTTQGALCIVGVNAACLAAADAATRCPGWKQWAFGAVILVCFVGVALQPQPPIVSKAKIVEECTKPSTAATLGASVPKLEKLTADYIAVRLDQLRAERVAHAYSELSASISGPSDDEVPLRRQVLSGDAGGERLRPLAQ